MKISRLFVLVAFLFVGAVSPEPATVVVLSSAGDVSVVDNGEPFLTVGGMTRREVPGWIATHFRAPEKPETVAVTLKTADGRRWRAVWTAIP